MTLIKEIIKYIGELFPILHANGFDFRVILMIAGMMEIIKRLWLKDTVYKSIKYHTKRLKTMVLCVFPISIIVSVLWNYNYFKTWRLYQIIFSSWIGSLLFYELLKLIGFKKLLDKIFKRKNTDE